MPETSLANRAAQKTVVAAAETAAAVAASVSHDFAPAHRQSSAAEVEQVAEAGPTHRFSFQTRRSTLAFLKSSVIGKSRFTTARMG